MGYSCVSARPPKEDTLTTTSRHSRSILAAEHHARETISEDIGEWDDECPKRISIVRRDFHSFVRFADNRYDSLKAALNYWRSQVISGEKDFDHDEEAEYKQAISALVSFADLLDKKYEAFSQRGISLCKPRVIGSLLARKREFEKALRDWKSPEWEAINERTVQWNKEQTRYLRERLSSVN